MPEDRGVHAARGWGARGAPSARSSILHGDRDQPVAPLSLVLSLVNHGLNRTRVIRSSFNRKQFNLGRESKSVTSKQEILHAGPEPRTTSPPPGGMRLRGWRQRLRRLRSCRAIPCNSRCLRFQIATVLRSFRGMNLDHSRGMSS